MSSPEITTVGITVRFLLIFIAIILAGTLIPIRFLKPFRSIRFNVLLFLVIVVFSAAGSFVPIGITLAEAEASFGTTMGSWFGQVSWLPSDVVGYEWGQALARIVYMLGFLNIYYSWWFAGLLGLMGFNVVACKLRKWPSPFGNPTFKGQDTQAQWERESKKFSQFRVNFSCSALSAETWNRFHSILSRRGYRIHEYQPSSPSGSAEIKNIRSERFPFQKWGDFILHISIVVILLGALMGSWFGFEERIALVESQHAKLQHRPWDIELKNFDIEYYQSTGQASLYASDVVVLKEKGDSIQHRILVNKPLDINRVRFYQATWGMTDQIRSATIQIGGSYLQMKPGENTSIPGTPLSVRINKFSPSFSIDEENRPLTVNFKGENPAVQMDFYNGNEIQVRVWLLKNFPDVAFQEKGSQVVQMPPPPFKLVDVDPILFSGLQIGYDPGAPLFWLGAITLLVGLCFHFYFHHRRVWIFTAPQSTKTVVEIRGYTSRQREDFHSEFDQIIDEIKRNCILPSSL